MDLEDIRTRIKDAYKSFSSYQDSGLIHTNRHGTKTVGWFKTYFLRPNQLLLEWSEDGTDDKNSLMVKGDKGQLLQRPSVTLPFKNNKRVQQTQGILPINLPMSGAGGISSGMTDTVLPLLIDSSKRPCFIHEKLALLRDEDVDGEPCYQLREIYKPELFWVSKNDFTVRRSESEGYPLLNDIMRTSLKAMIRLSEFFPTKEALPPQLKGSLDEFMRVDWVFESVQYNHFDENSFPAFEFKQ